MAFDTTADAERVLRAVWRGRSPDDRTSATIEMSETALRITMEGIAERHPDLDHRAQVRRYILRAHGVDIAAAP